MIDDLETTAIGTDNEVGCLTVVDEVSDRCLCDWLAVEFGN